LAGVGESTSIIVLSAVVRADGRSMLSGISLGIEAVS
jgi:hypothetical protein